MRKPLGKVTVNGTECIAVFGKGRGLEKNELAIIQAGLTREQIEETKAGASAMLDRLDPTDPNAMEIINGVNALTDALKIAESALSDDEETEEAV